jgi:hypothetical protein
MFNMQTVAAVAAQSITPIFHPDNWCRRRSSPPLIDSRIKGSTNDDLFIEEPSGCKRGADEMYDRQLQTPSVNQHLIRTISLTRLIRNFHCSI